MNNAYAIIKQYYESFNKKDLESFLSLLDDQIVHHVNQGQTQVGKKAFSEFMTHVFKCYNENVFDLKIATNDDGSWAAAEFVVKGTYLEKDHSLPEACQQPFQITCGAFFEITNQKITRMTSYYNSQEFIAQISNPR